jgi:hypothetical protein
MASGREAAARRRREREEHVAKQGEAEPIIPRDCKHGPRIVGSCRACQAYAAERERRGLIRNPFRIPY